MKKIFILFLAMFFALSCFAKTQKVVRYQVYKESFLGETYDITPDIQSMINNGWYVVSITPVTLDRTRSNPTDYIIVVFEKEI